MSIRRVFQVLLLLICSACLLAAQFPIPTNRIEEDTRPAQTRELVSKYCRLDYDGARLDPQAWPKIQPLVRWNSPPDYSQINVITRYSVDSEPTSSHGRYTVTVHYHLLGVYDLTTGYAPEPPGPTQDVAFTVTSENTGWRIADAENTFPHPSRAAMLKWLNAKISTTQEEGAKALLQSALKQLQAQSASPFAR